MAKQRSAVHSASGLGVHYFTDINGLFKGRCLNSMLHSSEDSINQQSIGMCWALWTKTLFCCVVKCVEILVLLREKTGYWIIRSDLFYPEDGSIFYLKTSAYLCHTTRRLILEDRILYVYPSYWIRVIFRRSARADLYMDGKVARQRNIGGRTWVLRYKTDFARLTSGQRRNL